MVLLYNNAEQSAQSSEIYDNSKRKEVERKDEADKAHAYTMHTTYFYSALIAQEKKIKKVYW